MTKAVTGTAAMQLVERKKLDLDSPANRWVPELADVQVLTGWDAGGQPITRAQATGNSAPHAHPHGRVGLRSLERRRRALSEGQGHPRDRNSQTLRCARLYSSIRASAGSTASVLIGRARRSRP